MSGSRFSTSPRFLLCGFLFGLVFMLIIGFEEHQGNSQSPTADSNDLKVLLEPGVFADIKIVVADVNAPAYPNAESLTICKGDYPFITIIKDSSGEVSTFSIANGEEGKIAIAMFKGGRISEFGVYGNKVHDNIRMPVFFLKASDKPGVWHKVKYAATSKAVKEKGRIKTYKVIGELYEDIDFDGQFDAKQVWDKDSKVISQSIFINEKWRELNRRTPDGEWKKLGKCNIEEQTAFTLVGKKKVYYDFQWGKGWKRRLKQSK